MAVGTVRKCVAGFSLLLGMGCVTHPAGTAIVDPPQPEGTVAFRGLLTEQPPRAPSTRYIFITHGMGPTEDEFANILLTRLTDQAQFTNERQWTGSEEKGWIPVQLPTPVHVSGEALQCNGGSVPPCYFGTFGGYKIDKLTRGNETLYVYRYFWDRSLRAVQEPFVKNDNEVRRSSLAAKMKHRIINYGFTDAAAYLGPLGAVIRSGAEGAICSMMKHAAAGGPPDQPGGSCTFAELSPLPPPGSPSFTFISQSLGSRLLFDTLDPAYNRRGCEGREADVKLSIIEQTDSFFMLANQLPLLALGQLEVRRSGEPRSGCPAGVEQLLSQSRQLSVGARALSGVARINWPSLPPLQIVSFQDPEDLLGFRFTDDLVNNSNDNVHVVQVLHRNTSVLGAFGKTGSSPMAAHAVELERDSSARLIFCGAVFGKGGRLFPMSDCLRL